MRKEENSAGNCGDGKVSESKVLDFSDFELKRISSKRIGDMIEKIHKLTDDFEEIEDTGEWMSPCGNCTACWGNNNTWYESFRRVGNDFSFAHNSCFKERFLYWKDGEEFPIEIAYNEGEKWILNETLKNREIVEIRKAFSDEENIKRWDFERGDEL